MQPYPSSSSTNGSTRSLPSFASIRQSKQASIDIHLQLSALQHNKRVSLLYSDSSFSISKTSRKKQNIIGKKGQPCKLLSISNSFPARKQVETHESGPNSGSTTYLTKLHSPTLLNSIPKYANSCIYSGNNEKTRDIEVMFVCSPRWSIWVKMHINVRFVHYNATSRWIITQLNI